MRRALVVVVIACTAVPGALAGTAGQPERVIPCDEIIDLTPFPYLGSYQKLHRYRLVLDSVSVPPAYLIRSYPSLQAAWPYFSKRGMVVKRGTAVTITVPPAWRSRVAIAWGNGGNGPFHTIRIAACRFSSPERGYAYAGGFFLRTPTACVPLTFIVGTRRKTMWVGIGRHCR
jgi:hypothetical protein